MRGDSNEPILAVLRAERSQLLGRFNERLKQSDTAGDGGQNLPMGYLVGRFEENRTRAVHGFLFGCQLEVRSGCLSDCRATEVVQV